VLTVVPEPTELLPLVRELARRAGARSAEHPIQIWVPGDLPLVMADRGRVQQVLGNLIDNAVKYSPAGGKIAITAERADSLVRVSVRDQGIGIPVDQLTSVFDRFHRGRDPRISRVRGVGLGLPICRGIVEAHGGTIWAERAPERGTVVRFTLRVAQPLLVEERTRPPVEMAAPAVEV
jgi:two-component system sensor histidine kinase KdpD